MQLFSTFDSNIYVELALKQMEQRGVTQENIFAVPLNNRIEKSRLFDSIHRADGVSLVDIGISLATGFSVIGVSVGLRLAWGPIIWGLISAIIGFVLGFVIKLIIVSVTRNGPRRLSGKHAEVILIINCEEQQADEIEKILWEHFALGVAKVKLVLNEEG